MGETNFDNQDARLATAVWETLSRTYSGFSNALEQELSAHGLTPAQFGVLTVLGANGPLALSEVARKTEVTAANVTLVVENLVKAGWVERVRDERDRRVTRAQATPAGLTLLETVGPAYHARVLRLTQGLTADEQEILMRLQKKLLGSLTRPAGI
jgi:DNA-binding MarR family transcriptional regulator